MPGQTPVPMVRAGSHVTGRWAGLKTWGGVAPEAFPSWGVGSGASDRAGGLFLELSNVEFHCGKAEDLVPALVSRLASQQLVAILDPPRAGLREWLLREVVGLRCRLKLGDPSHTHTPASQIPR